MKLFKNLKKGFTLIELVVVIAVIAILSAVSVVSYVAITNKAKTSADEQAVTQMNTVLLSNEVMDLRSINDVFDAFKENGIEGEDYKPLVKDRYFFWDQDENKIIYTDEDYKVLFPESMKGQGKGDHQWFSLTQTLKTVKTESITTSIEGGKSYAVSTPEQFYSIGKELKDAMLGRTNATNYTVNPTTKDIEGKLVFELTQDLDLMGGSFNFNLKGDFTLKGNGHTIRGVVNNTDFVQSKSAEGHDEEYGTGIIGYLRGTSTARFEDVTIENCVFGSSKSKGAGALVGYSAGNIEVKNVVVKNCTMTAFEHGCGGLIGDVQGGTVKLEGTNSVTNCNLILVEGKESDGGECYGIGNLIGRCSPSVPAENICSVNNGTFTSSNNKKVYGSKNTEKVNPGRLNFSYLDSLTSRKTWEE